MSRRKERIGLFAGGMAATAVLTKILTSEKTRECAVTGLAKGMKLQMDAQAKFQTIKEEAQDLCYDAKEEAGSDNSEKKIKRGSDEVSNYS